MVHKDLVKPLQASQYKYNKAYINDSFKSSCNIEVFEKEDRCTL
jgi:hypothetical protein